MATSSIFADFNITDAAKAEAFVKALDSSAQENASADRKTKKPPIVLPSDIKSLWARRKESE